MRFGRLARHPFFFGQDLQLGKKAHEDAAKGQPQPWVADDQRPKGALLILDDAAEIVDELPRHPYSQTKGRTPEGILTHAAVQQRFGRDGETSEPDLALISGDLEPAVKARLP